MKYWRSIAGSLACGVVIAGAGSGLAEANTAAHAQPAATAREFGSQYQQNLARTLSMVSGDSIASFFLNLAKDPAKNFIMEKLGFETTSSQLRDLASKLNALHDQLNEFEKRVTGLIVDLQLTAAVTEANHAADGLGTFYLQYFSVLGTDLVNVKVAQDKGDAQEIATALKQYNTDKEVFVSTAANRGLDARILQLRHAFDPGSGATGLMKAVGTSLLQRHEYLTPADSDTERAIYVYYEENQALAAWMTCEMDIARNHLELVAAVVTEFEQAVAAQRNPDTPNGLPPLLPPHVMLDRGTNPATMLDSRNKAMYTDTRVNQAVWPPDRAGFTSSNPGQVPRVLAEYNKIGWEGFSNWAVPTQAEVYALFNELGPQRDAGTIQEYLQRLNLNISGADFIWTRDAAQRWVSLYDTGRALTYQFDVYEGISLRNLSADERPRLCGNDGTYRDPCRFSTTAELIARYDAAKGGVYLIRNSGSIRYF
jgi:hypothetical protein